MAGRGPAPKPKNQRVTRHAPQRGEWVDLEPLAAPILPLAEADWPENGKRMWNAWRLDPVTTQYGVADVAAISEFARLYDDLPPAEQRIRMDGLGLTPKGKRDLRWRTPAEVATIAKQKPADVRRLRVVDAKGA